LPADVEAPRRQPCPLDRKVNGLATIDCSAVELLRRSRNLRAVQAHLRHSDIQTTTVYTEMTQTELQKVVNLFDDDGK
jgi:site-specific recombinase XerC